MTVEEVEKQALEQMEKILNIYIENIKKIQVGKLDTDIFSNVMVTTDNQKVPLKKIASTTIIDVDTIEIKPWAEDNIQDIYKTVGSLQKDLGVNYSALLDKKRVLLKFDMVITKETRNNLVTLCGKKTEESKIVLRNLRHEILGKVKETIKNNEEFKKIEKKFQVHFDKYNKILEEKQKSKVSTLLGA